MDWLKENAYKPATIGVTAALGAGLLKYLGLNVGVETNTKSIIKIFLLVTTAGLINEEFWKEKIR